MANKLEIKGLAASVQNTRRSIAILRAEIAGLNADSWDLQKTVAELREQVKQTHDDLKFEAENLTNAPIEDVTGPEDADLPVEAPSPVVAPALNGPALEEKVHRYRSTDHGTAAFDHTAGRPS